MSHVEAHDGGEPAASLHAVAPIRPHADRESHLLARIVNGFHHRSPGAAPSTAMNDPQAAQLAHRNPHSLFGDRRHIGCDDGNTQRYAGHRRGEISIGTGVHLAVARDEHNIVEGVSFAWSHGFLVDSANSLVVPRSGCRKRSGALKGCWSLVLAVRGPCVHSDFTVPSGDRFRSLTTAGSIRRPNPTPLRSRLCNSAFYGE